MLFLYSIFYILITATCAVQHTETKQKHLKTLSENHYSRALRLYQQMECHLEYLQTQLEFIAMLDLTVIGECL